MKNRAIISMPFLLAFVFIIFNIPAFMDHSKTVEPTIEINKRKIDVTWMDFPCEKLNNTFITALSKSSDLIWIGTWSEGLIVYDYKKGKCSAITFGNENPIISLFTNSIECWFGLGDGAIGKIRFNDNVCELYNLGKSDQHSWFESIIYFDKKLWFASPEEIIAYDPKNDVWSKINLPISTMEFQQWKNDFVMKTIRASSGWALSTAEYQTDKKKYASMLALKNTVQKRLAEGKSIKEIFSEQINLRGLNSIILRKNIKFNISEQKLIIVYHDKVLFLSPTSELINTIALNDINYSTHFSDAIILKEKVALASYNEGLFIYNLKDKNIKHLKRARVKSLWEIYNKGLGPWSEEDSIISIISDNNILWLATMKGRIIKYNIENEKIQIFIKLYPYNDGFANTFIRKDDIFLIGTSKGLLCFDPLGKEKVVFNRGRWINYEPKDDIPELDFKDKVIYATICEYLGAPYYWGRRGLSGTDCSGFVISMFNRLGVYMPHRSALQHDNEIGSTQIDQLKFGDLLFFGDPISHVGVYMGEGHFAHSSGSAKGVNISSLSDGFYKLTGVKRISPDKDQKGFVVISESIKMLEYPDEKSKAVMKLRKGEIVKLISKEGSWLFVECSKDVAGWVMDKDVASAQTIDENTINNLILLSSNPLLKPSEIKETDLPFKINNSKVKNVRYIKIEFDNKTNFIHNGIVMLVILSKKSCDESLRKNISAEIKRIEILKSQDDLHNIGFIGKQFESYNSGIVALLKITSIDKKTMNRYIQLKCPLSETEAYYLVSLKGSSAGTMYQF
ncbi:MAG: NlpC/P60 family protein [bacterium]